MTAFRRHAGPKPKGGGGGGAAGKSAWLAADGSKRWGEKFFLLYTPFWLTLCLGIIVPFKLYERFTELEYLVLGLVSTGPAFLIPLFLVGKIICEFIAPVLLASTDEYIIAAIICEFIAPVLLASTDEYIIAAADSIRSLKDRYWVKANVWIIIFSYVGNYFWTHYFFTVLGASYTFPSWRMNNVPHTTFFLTHACFLMYHMAANMTLRRLRHTTAHLPQSIRWSFDAAWILAFSYFIAYLETLAIANFPYYEFVDRDAMYTVGSMFYAIYFLVSFPMFLRIDEKAEKWGLGRVAVDALGAAMLVTIILDLWRIFLGPIVPIPESRWCGQPGLAWFQAQNESI